MVHLCVWALVLHALAMSILPVPLNVRAQHQAVLEAEPPSNRATLPVDNATLSFWLRDPGVSPAPDEGSEGDLTADADICIIGSGITGVSAAYHLARTFAKGEGKGEDKPLKVVILEARDFCASLCIFVRDRVS